MAPSLHNASMHDSEGSDVCMYHIPRKQNPSMGTEAHRADCTASTCPRSPEAVNPSPSQASPSSKTIRLLSEGRVEPTGLVHEFKVVGDHGIYRAFVSADLEPIACTCPARGRCAHLDASVLRAAADPATAALLDRAVAERAERGAEA